LIAASVAAICTGGGFRLAELQLVAMNPPIDETKLVVAKSLTDDGRIGKISDAQGIVVLRPMLAQRWTPICREMLLKPGDWLRTYIRGANAAKIHFTSDVELILGPGTLVECISPTQARIHTGEAQVYISIGNPPDKAKNNDKSQKPTEFELLAPRAGSQKFSTPATKFLRVDRNENLVEVKQLPKWLAGFEGTSADESLGSLIVNLPDGRNEPLSIGYHKVSVEIRDQIARTTIEESFVNHTSARLEGVFHFPLPQDASISGFGMWIGDDLVEADIVEKQRAREIYETILREKRDPGLFEWTSGNLFKARVFPIEANSEKRVRIVYTQVLPLRANKYRYTYGLRSDLLRMKPVRELSLKVMVNSAIPLKSIACPTHAARIERTEHSATVEFAAQEYSPDGDFEVDCEIDGKQSDTQEAVDAVSAAIVCWSPGYRQRAGAIGRLKTVLSSAKNLDAFVDHLNEEAKKTGQDSPLLRKTLGEVYQSRKVFAKAIAQFDLARQLQPNDKETYQASIACYDALGQASNATKQLLALVDFDRHDLQLYKQLADRLKNDEAEAERAATSIIEAGPNEAENHQAMAELRQKQNRWNEAIAEWKDVAELRRLEPTGLLKLAEAEIHEKQWNPAGQTLDRLDNTDWPSRFNDVGNQIRRLRSMLPQ
jgi:hypothetical protein